MARDKTVKVDAVCRSLVRVYIDLKDFEKTPKYLIKAEKILTTFNKFFE